MTTHPYAPDDWGALHRDLTARRKSDGFTPTDPPRIRVPDVTALPIVSAEEQARMGAEAEVVAKAKYTELVASIRRRCPAKYRQASRADFDGLPVVPWEHVDGVLIAGNVGIGKTHAASAIALEYATPAYPVPTRFNAADILRWHTAPMVLVNIRATFRDGAASSEREIIDELTRCAVLVLDDLGAEKVTDFSTATLYAVLSERENRGRKTIVTTNQSLQDLDAWEPRLASRLNAYFRVRLPDVDRRADFGARINRRP